MARAEWECEIPVRNAEAWDDRPGPVGGVAFAGVMSLIAFGGLTAAGAAVVPALLAAPWLGTVLGLGVLAATTRGTAHREPAAEAPAIPGQATGGLPQQPAPALLAGPAASPLHP